MDSATVLRLAYELQPSSSRLLIDAIVENTMGRVLLFPLLLDGNATHTICISDNLALATSKAKRLQSPRIQDRIAIPANSK